MVLMYNWRPLFDFSGNIDTSLVTDVNKGKKLEIAVVSSLCTRLLAPFRSKYKSNHQKTRTVSYQELLNINETVSFTTVNKMSSST